MYVERHRLAITTDGSGDAIAYTPTVFGRILSVIYTKTDFANGVDITITAEATAQSVLTLTDQNASGSWHPRSQVHGPTGTGLTYDGTRTVNEPICVVDDRIKVVIAQGGNTKSGTIDIVIG